jgi:hypothetical protein
VIAHGSEAKLDPSDRVAIGVPTVKLAGPALAVMTSVDHDVSRQPGAPGLDTRIEQRKDVPESGEQVLVIARSDVSSRLRGTRCTVRSNS